MLWLSLGPLADKCVKRVMLQGKVRPECEGSEQNMVREDSWAVE